MCYGWGFIDSSEEAFVSASMQRTRRGVGMTFQILTDGECSSIETFHSTHTLLTFMHKMVTDKNRLSAIQKKWKRSDGDVESC